LCRKAFSTILCSRSRNISFLPRRRPKGGSHHQRRGKEKTPWQDFEPTVKGSRPERLKVRKWNQGGKADGGAGKGNPGRERDYLTKKEKPLKVSPKGGKGERG